MTRSRWRFWALWIVLAVIIIVIDSPLLNAVLTSIKTSGDINSFPPKWIFGPTLIHYHHLFDGQYPFLSYFMNSIIISVGASILVVLVTFPGAYAMVRLGAGKRLLGSIVSLRLLPPIIFAIPFYVLFQNIGLLDTKIGLILINALFNLPLSILLFISFIQELPYELEEAGYVDGCTTYGLLWRIVFPLIAPGAASVMILTFVFTWNEFLFALILTAQNAIPITVGATMFITSWGIKWGDISAAIVLSVLPPLLFTIVLQKYLVKSMAMGGLKG